MSGFITDAMSRLIDGPPEVERPVCPECFMQRALNGACGCEEES